MRRLALCAVLWLAPSLASAQGEAVPTGYFFAMEKTLNLTFAESMLPIQHVVVNLRLDDAGALAGNLVLDPNALEFNEFGDEIGRGADEAQVSLDFTLKLQKEADGKRLYSIRGPKITSRLSLAFVPDGFGGARLLLHNRDGKVKRVVTLFPPLHEPCHPGCFPKGSLVLAGDGVRPIEKLRAGDSVTTIGADGLPAAVKIEGVFETRNRLIEVRCEGGKLVTTPTQPLALEGGDFRAAGEVKAGDSLLRWTGEKAEPIAVLEVAVAADDAAVYNLVLGEPTIFVVGDYLVRSKPPAAAAPPP
jgi:hypothetical protein